MSKYWDKRETLVVSSELTHAASNTNVAADATSGYIVAIDISGTSADSAITIFAGQGGAGGTIAATSDLITGHAWMAFPSDARPRFTDGFSVTGAGAAVSARIYYYLD